MSERKKVTVRGETITFPSACSNCLGKTDLTSYRSRWETKYMGQTAATRVWRSGSINIPICQSCKKTLIKKERTYGASMFAILAPFTWGIALIATMQPGVGEYLASLWNSGFVGTLLGLFWLVLFLLTLVGIWVIIDPQKFLKWPITLEKPKYFPENDAPPNPSTHTFSFANETYAKLFENANAHILLHPANA